MKHLEYYFIVLAVLIGLGWQIINRVAFREEMKTSLDIALQSAENNREELERVLRHYQNSPTDSLKYKAACFLIENMPASSGSTLQSLAAFSPLYEDYDSINRIYDFRSTSEWGKKIDGLYKKYPHLLHAPYGTEDLSSIKSEYLMQEIDRSFEVWKRNVYSSKSSFDDFCEYILPYRRLNGLVADNARDTFYHRHIEKYYTRKGRDWLEETDSLLHEYSHLTHSDFWGAQIPVLNAETFEYLRHGLCIHRCWYNSLLLSSLGMPVAIDLVPAWGNRNSSHTWNVLLLDGQSYAFEAFWDNDRCKYKRIYNNSVSDSLWGKFRLPKIYRHTYSNHLEGPVADSGVDRNDIPPFFRNIKMMDVSAEYFEPHDVTVTLTEPCPENARYAYYFKDGILSPAAYVRLYLPTDMLCAGEIAFYTDRGRIPAVKVLSDITPLSAMEGADKLTDGLEATTCRGKVAGRCVDFDLGGLFQLTAVGVYPYLESQIFEDVGYALRYWDGGGWKVKDMKRGAACGWLEFDDVPLNALMVLKNMKWKPFSGERIFICKDESIYWE